MSCPEVVDRLTDDGALVSGGGPASVITECVRNLMDSGRLEEHVQFVRGALGARMVALRDALEQVFGDRIVCREAYGGYFVCEYRAFFCVCLSESCYPFFLYKNMMFLFFILIVKKKACTRFFGNFFCFSLLLLAVFFLVGMGTCRRDIARTYTHAKTDRQTDRQTECGKDAYQKPVRRA
jgi:hypothetical protein